MRHDKFINWAAVDPSKPVFEPTRAHEDDAGFDLYVSKDITVYPNEFVDIPTNIRMIFPRGHWGMLTGRSSTLRKRGLLVNQGIIDTGYRGELYAGVWNLTGDPVAVHEGERLSQLIIMENPTERTKLMQAPASLFDTLEHARGTSGFGSSGL